jgi:hypothetical protein
MVCECASATSRSVRSLSLMVSAIRCSDAYNLVDSASQRSTTSRNRVAATPPQTEAGTLVIWPMNAEHGAHLVVSGVDSACHRGDQPEVGVQ